MTALQCPLCDHFEWVSEEDPDATLSDMLNHLRGYYAGQHRLSMAEAMRELANVNEVERAWP
jgi:hypothetical protein